MPRRHIARLLLLPWWCAWLAACAGAPVRSTPPPLSEAQQLQLAAPLDAEIRRELGVVGDAALQRELQQLGDRLIASSSILGHAWQFTILDVAAANAFALPTGHVYVTRGLLPYLDDDAELAAVVAHEIAHVMAGHARIVFTAGDGVDSPSSAPGIFWPVARRLRGRLALFPNPAALFVTHAPEEEREADRMAARLLVSAGLPASALASALVTLARLDVADDDRGVPTFVQTHGDQGSLLGEIRTLVDDADPGAARRSGPATHDAYLQRIHGLVFGDDPREGIVRGNECIHPFLGVAVTLPAGWDMNSGRSQVVAKAPDEDAYVVAASLPAALRLDVAGAAALVLDRAGLQQVDGHAEAVNGHPAFVATAVGTVQGLGAIRMRAAWVLRGRDVIEVAGIAPSGRFASVEARFDACIRSIRFLDAAESGRLLPQRIDIESAQQGDTWEKIARRHGGVVMPIVRAEINHADVAAGIRAGSRIKVVVAR